MRSVPQPLAPAPPPGPGPGGVPGAGVDAHRTAIWRYLRMLGAAPDEADDLGQETMLIGCRTTLPDDAPHARAFLRGVARNLWLRSRRWWARRREREVAAAVEELWQRTADDDGGDELITQLRDCFAGLQPRAREALELHYRDGLPWQAIAAHVALSANGTKTLAQRARAALRQCLERRKA